MLVCTRLNFTATLRRRLGAAAQLLPAPDRIDLSLFSGISFRRAGLQQLWGRVSRHRIMDHAGHADFKSSRSYAGATDFAARRDDTFKIAEGFANKF